MQKLFGRKIGIPRIVTVPVSFETGEAGAYKVYFPFAATITGIKGVVVKAIADTDNGTVTGANSTGNSTSGVLTATASDPLGTEYTASPTTNVNVPAGSYYKLTTAKSTAGGKILVTLQYKTA